MARGSLEETLSHLLFAFEAKFIPNAIYKQFETDGEEIDKMLNGYIAFLKKSKQGANEPGAGYSTREAIASYSVESLEDAATANDIDL